jgi:hypothetical protein
MRADDWRVTTAYVDLDPVDVQVLDYECRAFTYDGHGGNDFAILDFVEQDEGRYVLAAADGTVSETGDGAFDKNTGSSGGGNNGVILMHDDGTESHYYHFKKRSVLVYPGQRVREGQPIGMVGSSGSSTGPHLHFGVKHDDEVYEPHAGACRSGESLWSDQEGHAFDRTYELVYAGMSTVSPGSRAYVHRPPDVHHVRQTEETVHYSWARVIYRHPGDTVSVTYRRPDGVEHYHGQKIFTSSGGLTTWIWDTTLPASGHLGTWTIEFRLNGVLEREMTFVYDDVPYEDPIGEERSVDAPRGFAHGELEASDADSGIREFGIVTAPEHGWVSLHGPRNRYFSYMAASGYDGSDSFSFEAIDGQGQSSSPATITVEVSPIVANCVRFQDEEDRVVVPDNGSLNPSEALTVEAWVYRRTGSAYGETIVDRRRDGDNKTGWVLSIPASSQLRFRAGDGTGYVSVFSASRIPLRKWVHVAGVWDGSMLRLYVDGTPEPDAAPFAGPIDYPGTYDTSIGRRGSGQYGLFGDLDEVRIWSIARSAADLAEGAQCSFFESPPPDTLLARWPFEGNAEDASAYGNHGTLTAPGSFVKRAGAVPVDCPGVDSDGDGVMDRPDNCPLAPNADQADSDGDGAGDACDMCPGVVVSGQWDSDEDGVADACDVCPFVADSEQIDTDGDGAGDLCDPDSDDSLLGVPSGDITVSLVHDKASGTTDITWSAEPMATSYETYRGSREEVRDLFYGTCQNARDADTTDTSFVEDEEPAAGSMFAFLVVGVGESGTRGLAGVDSFGRQRDVRAKDCL